MDFLFDHNRFYLGPDPSAPLAEITFVKRGEHTLVVDHTFTEPSLRGQGIARRLVDRVALYAREQGFKVGATCPYALKILQEEQFSDIFSE